MLQTHTQAATAADPGDGVGGPLVVRDEDVKGLTSAFLGRLFTRRLESKDETESCSLLIITVVLRLAEDVLQIQKHSRVPAGNYLRFFGNGTNPTQAGNAENTHP